MCTHVPEFQSIFKQGFGYHFVLAKLATDNVWVKKFSNKMSASNVRFREPLFYLYVQKAMFGSLNQHQSFPTASKSFNPYNAGATFVQSTKIFEDNLNPVMLVFIE